jgi:hypothetical protein
MLAYCAAALWGVCILLSMIGHGSIVKRLLCPDQKIDWGLRAAWGLPFSACVGGVLEVTGTISRTTVLLFLSVGLLSFALDIPQMLPAFDGASVWSRLRNERVYKLSAALMVLAGLFLAARYAGSVSLWGFGGNTFPSNFNVYDDFQAYYVFPHKMLDAGSMGPEPFSVRRIASALGGQSFLQTFVISMLSERNINILDIGIGSILISGLLLGWLQTSKPLPGSGPLTVILFLLLRPPSVNSTSLLTAMALYLSLFRTLASRELCGGRATSRALLVGLQAAALCSLKSSHFLFCATLLGFTYTMGIVRSKFQREIVTEALLACAFSVLLLLPWMMDMYRANGTPLYPILGHGYIAYGYPGLLDAYAWLSSWSVFPGHILRVPRIPYLALGVLALFGATRRGIGEWETNATLGMLASVCLGTIGTAKALGAFSGLYRYLFPFVVAGALIAGMQVLVRANSYGILVERLEGSVILAAAIGALLLAGPSLLRNRAGYLALARSAVHGLRPASLVTADVVERHRQVQQAIPPGATVMARLERPFLLDFRRNPILIDDWPGFASLPPGVPFFKGSEALSSFLTAHSIRYVAYDYATEAGLRNELHGVTHDKDSFVGISVALILDLQGNLRELCDTRKRIYDDGSTAVVDLSQATAK